MPTIAIDDEVVSIDGFDKGSDSLDPACRRRQAVAGFPTEDTGLLGLRGVLAAGGLSTWLVLSKRRFVSATSSTPTPVKVAPGTTFVTYKGHLRRVYSLAWSPDGKYIASSSEGEVRVWEPLAPAGRTSNTYSDEPESVHAVTWSPDGQRIASGGDSKTVQVWQAI